MRQVCLSKIKLPFRAIPACSTPLATAQCTDSHFFFAGDTVHCPVGKKDTDTFGRFILYAMPP